MTPEIFQSLQGFTDTGLVILIIGGGFWFLTWKGYIQFDFRTKETKKERKEEIKNEQKEFDINELVKAFATSTEAMKQMSNDNVHELAGNVLDVVKLRFESIENLIQNEMVFQNRNLVSGLRDEIKIGMNNIGGLKYEMKESTKKLNQAIIGFDKLCKNCEFRNKK